VKIIQEQKAQIGHIGNDDERNEQDAKKWKRGRIELDYRLFKTKACDKKVHPNRGRGMAYLKVRHKDNTQMYWVHLESLGERL